jgi:hypothetical protein
MANTTSMAQLAANVGDLRTVRHNSKGTRIIRQDIFSAAFDGDADLVATMIHSTRKSANCVVANSTGAAMLFIAAWMGK